MTNIVHVAVAVIMDANNKVCITLRSKNSHQGGLWEFPGGKIEPGETVEQALSREIKEELNLAIKSSRPLITITHAYPEVSVCLHVQKVLVYSGKAKGMEGQRLKWEEVAELLYLDFPKASAPIISALQLPERYLITGSFNDQNNFIYKLKNALKSNIRLVQLRLKNENLERLNDPQQLIEDVAAICKNAEAKLLLNLSETYTQSIDFSKVEFSGFHADSASLMKISKRPEGKLFSASCHNESELEKALRLKADFIVLSPVKKTSSHPDAKPIGWNNFTKLTEGISLPVYALGGLSEIDLNDAWSNGAQGVAAISAFWK